MEVLWGCGQRRSLACLSSSPARTYLCGPVWVCWVLPACPVAPASRQVQQGPACPPRSRGCRARTALSVPTSRRHRRDARCPSQARHLPCPSQPAERRASTCPVPSPCPLSARTESFFRIWKRQREGHGPRPGRPPPP